MSSNQAGQDLEARRSEKKKRYVEDKNKINKQTDEILNR